MNQPSVNPISRRVSGGSASSSGGPSANGPIGQISMPFICPKPEHVAETVRNTQIIIKSWEAPLSSLRPQYAHVKSQLDQCRQNDEADCKKYEDYLNTLDAQIRRIKMQSSRFWNGLRQLKRCPA